MPVCVFRLDTDRSAVDESVRYVETTSTVYNTDNKPFLGFDG